METVGNYKIVRQLRIDGPGGGMSKLYIAYRRGPDELEGLQSKVLLKHQAVTSPELVDHFLMEARLGLKLVHPNIARVTDVFKDAGQLWLAMEFIEGVNAAQLWAADRARVAKAESPRLGLDMIVQLLMQAAEALDYAHNLRVDGVHARIVHRDVTPDNLMVSGIGNVFVIDFGIATADAIDWRQRTEGQIIKGKTGYLAPELLHGERADQRTDVYGLGIVATELLTGERAFPQETKEAKYVQIMLGDLPPIRSKNPSVPAELAQFIETMRHAQRDQRVASARDVYEGFYRLRPSAAAPAVKRQLGALAIEMTAPYRTKSSPWHQAPAVRTLALPVGEDLANRPAPTAAASSEPNAPQYVQTRASPVEAETHKVANGEIVSLALAPPPAAPTAPRNLADKTHQDRRQLHHLPTVKLSEHAQAMVAEHLSGAERSRSRKRAAVTAAFVSLTVAVLVVATFRVLGARAGSPQPAGERTNQPPPEVVAAKQPAPTVAAPALIPAPAKERPAPPAAASADALTTPHHRKKTTTKPSAPTTFTDATDSIEDPPSTVGVISVAASDREVRYVFVDNVQIGTAPKDYEVMPGRHHVVVTAIDKSGVPVQRLSEWVAVKGGDHRLVGSR